ncbi:MAG: 3-isopropylmalate dehydratase [Candidatus Lokiarchaeota archaeon]|nr:3-isopropylmalate dehydratase [Candidatus Harpocratesius repetitus]
MIHNSPLFSPIVEGRVWRVGDSIDTDLIVPSHVLTEQDYTKLLEATLESVIPNFAKQVQKGDIIIAGKNFGCGSSREEAVFVLKELGIRAIIAESFARIFFRNAINLGLPVIKFPASQTIGKQWDKLRIDLIQGTMKNLNTQQIFKFSNFSPFILRYIEKGGAIQVIKERLHL